MAQAAASSVPRRSAVPLLLGLPVLALLTLGALALSQPLAAVGVPLLAGLAYALYRLPLKVSAIFLMALVFFSEGLENSLGNIWTAPGHDLAKLMMDNMSAWTGVGFLRAPLVDVLTLGLYAMASFRDRK